MREARLRAMEQSRRHELALRGTALLGWVLVALFGVWSLWSPVAEEAIGSRVGRFARAFPDSIAHGHAHHAHLHHVQEDWAAADWAEVEEAAPVAQPPARSAAPATTAWSAGATQPPRRWLAPHLHRDGTLHAHEAPRDLPADRDEHEHEPTAAWLSAQSGAPLPPAAVTTPACAPRFAAPAVASTAPRSPAARSRRARAPPLSSV